jgi:hypothetical protein
MLIVRGRGGRGPLGKFLKKGYKHKQIKTDLRGPLLNLFTTSMTPYD